VQINDTVVAVGEVSLYNSGSQKGVVNQIIGNLLVINWKNGKQSYCTDDPSHPSYNLIGVEVLEFEELWE